MKYLDSNILIRLITNDVPELARQALKMIEDNTSEDIMVLEAVITEVCFILEFNPSYRLPRTVIYDALYAIMDLGGLQAGEHTHEALDLYVAHPGYDYVDCLLLVSTNGKRSSLLTFDKALIRKTR